MRWADLKMLLNNSTNFMVNIGCVMSIIQAIFNTLTLQKNTHLSAQIIIWKKTQLLEQKM
jgi:hypothetical protein